MTARSFDPADLRQDLDRLDARTETGIVRIDEVQARLGGMNSNVNVRFSGMNARFTEMNARLDRRKQQVVDLRHEMSQRFAEQRGYIDQRLTDMRSKLLNHRQVTNRLVAGGVILLLIPSRAQWLGPALMRLPGLAG